MNENADDSLRGCRRLDPLAPRGQKLLALALPQPLQSIVLTQHFEVSVTEIVRKLHRAGIKPRDQSDMRARPPHRAPCPVFCSLSAFRR